LKITSHFWHGNCSTLPMKRKKYAKITLMIGLLILIGSVLLPASELELYVDAALKNSMSGRLNDLERTVSTLQWERSELEQPEKEGVSVSTGEGTLSYANDLTGDQIVTFEPSATVTFHDLDLAITLTAPITLNATDTVISSTPKVSIQKILETYNPEEDTTLEDLESAAIKMNIDRNYYAGRIGIEKSVLQSIKEFITLEKSILITEKSIFDAELALVNDLNSGLLKEGTTAWTLRNNSITRLKNTLAAANNNISAARDNFKTITGIDYEVLTSEDIPHPDITLKALVMGNSIVLNAAMDVEIAKQKLTEELSSGEFSEMSDSSFTYLLNGSYKAGINQPAVNFNHTLQAGISAANAEFEFEAGISTVIDSTSITPTAYISGRWTEPQDNWEEYDELIISILENQAVEAEQRYMQTYSDYLSDIQVIQLRISNWNINSVEMDLAYSENILKLEDADYAYSKGFGTISDVQKFNHDLQIIEYDKMLLDIDGMLIERDVRLLQL